jgi:hypothetical protein
MTECKEIIKNGFIIRVEVSEAMMNFTVHPYIETSEAIYYSNKENHFEPEIGYNEETCRCVAKGYYNFRGMIVASFTFTEEEYSIDELDVLTKTLLDYLKDVYMRTVLF